MKRFLPVLALCVFLFAPALHAQNFTFVTGCFNDARQLVYSNGTISATLTPSVPGGYTLGGFPYSGQIPLTNLDQFGCMGAGAGGIQVGSNAAITPAGSQWVFTINFPGIAPPFGTGAQSVTETVSISGANQDISLFNAPALTVPFSTSTITGGGSVGNLAVWTSNTNLSATPWQVIAFGSPGFIECIANSCGLTLAVSGVAGSGFTGVNPNAAPPPVNPAGPGFNTNQSYALSGTTSGVAAFTAAAVQGNPCFLQLPTTSPAANQTLISAAPIGSNPSTCQESWATPTILSCAYQGPLAAVTGTGAAATFYTCSVPALAAGTGIAITVTAKHTTGTAAVSYTVQFGGTSTTASAPAGSANQIEVIRCVLMNNPGSTTAQTVTTTYQDSAAATNSIQLNTMAINTGSAQTLNLQFNVAATDQITPEQFLVQIVR